MKFKEKMIRKIYDEFRNRFDAEPVLIQSPGRVNLIGEHTDYNDGFVLPAAINKKMILAMAPNAKDTCHFYASDMNEIHEAELHGELNKSSKQWANYILGAIDQLQQRGDPIEGFDCVFGGDIPIGAGLSSSAALEGGVIFGLSQFFNLGLSPLDMALIGQRVENEFVGVQCGIMDQFVNIHGKTGYALKLDCRSLEFERYPFRRSDISIILCDTGIRRELAGSEYNIRRKQCEDGVRTLQNHDPDIRNLRDVDLEMLNQFKKELDPVVYKRCSYVLEENKRVHAACEDLTRDDFESFGGRMYESHNGLRDKYEVSCEELDTLVEIAETSKGVLGARMMGGGFGGCTINIVENKHSETFSDDVRTRYKEMTGDEIEIYRTSLSGGTKSIPVKSGWKEKRVRSNK